MAQTPFVMRAGRHMEEIFRRAKAADFEAVAALYEKAVSDLRSKQIDQWDEIYPDSKTLRADIRKRQMYVLTRDGGIVSAVVLGRKQHELYKTVRWSCGRPAVLHRLCVHPEHQHLGVGRATVVCAEQRLRKKHRCSVRLDAFLQNPAALRLYESLGYTRVGVVHFRKGEFGLYEKSISGHEAVHTGA
jgi:ribosomal protein S18 acetylase RimI-like enzyme